jgi:hypothetical protein
MWLSILDKHLQLSKQGRTLISTISITHHIVALVTLCDKGIKQSQSSWEADDSESNLTLQGKPNSQAWNTKGSFRSNHLPFIPTRGSDPPQTTAGPYALPKCRTYVCSATTKPVFLVALATRIPQSNQVTRRTKYMWWEVCPLLGPIGY